MPQSVYSGNWQTRRVKLAADEEILRRSNASRSGIMGIFYSVGVLTLTTNRLIWTPFPYIAEISSWAAPKSELLDVSVVDLKKKNPWLYSFQRWHLRVQTTTETRYFGFGGLGTGRQKNRAVEWLEAVQTWKN